MNPRIRKPTLVGIAAAGALLLAAGMRPAPDAGRPAERPERPHGGNRPQLPPRIDSPTPSLPERPEAVLPPPTPDRVNVVRPSEEVESDVDLLQAWLLGLGNDELAGLLDTPALDRLIARVVAGLTRRTPDAMASARDIDDFLSRINIRCSQAMETHNLRSKP